MNLHLQPDARDEGFVGFPTYLRMYTRGVHRLTHTTQLELDMEQVRRLQQPPGRAAECVYMYGAFVPTPGSSYFRYPVRRAVTADLSETPTRLR